MPSELKVNKLSPYTGSTLTIGDSGDTISFASGVLPSLESLTITGDLTVDTNTLFVDSSTNRVGIGTTSPVTTLEVIGSINLSDGGTQGILVRSDGSIEISRTDGNAFIDFKTSTSEDRDARIRQVSDGLSFETGGNGSVSEAMRITSSGYVGIGTSSPSEALVVIGKTSFGSDWEDNTGTAYDTYQFGSYLDGTAAIQIKSTNQGAISFSDSNSTRYGIILYLHTDDSMSFWTNNAERVRIDSSGNVGIGTSSPSNKTHITSSVSGTTPVLRVENSNSDGLIGFKRTSGTPSDDYVLGADSTRMYFRNNTTSTDLISILEGGNVGIGTSSPATNLHVVGGMRQQRSGGNSFEWAISSGGNYFLTDITNATERMRIDSSGNVGIGTTSPVQKLDVNGNIRVNGAGIVYSGITSGTTNRIAFRWSSPNLSGAVDNVAFFVVGTNSDYRLKNNVENLSSVLDKINLLRPITFNAVPLQEGDVVNDVNHIGFIAHEVAEHFPSLVEGEKDAVNDEGNNLYQGLNYAGFTPILTKAIQELKADNDALRSTVADLTARLEALENA